jgi:ribonuclease R
MQPTVRGSLSMNPGGFGFITREDGKGSLFVPPARLGGALDGDIVISEVQKAERGNEGTVVAVERRGRSRIVGVLEQAGNHTWRLIPDDPRIVHRIHFVDDPIDVQPGTLIAAKIIDYPEPGDSSIGVRMDRELGAAGELQSEALRILLENGVDEGFSKEILKEAKHVPAEVREKDRKGRADLLHLDFMTIDPPDARDFDDAVAVEYLGDNHDACDMRLWVAVADVSHYVRIGTEIDHEAQLRSYSVYLPDRAIPMLPEQLSSHMCSLVPNADRLAMVVSLRVDAQGLVHEPQVMASVIHSRKRLSYNDAAQMMAGNNEGFEPVIAQRIFALRQCADRLRNLRLKRGAIELSLPESKIILEQDDRSRIRDIVQTKADPQVARAYNLIEELMLAANEAVGALAVLHGLPVVYRVHDLPDATKIEHLAAAAEAMGVKADPEVLVSAKGMQDFLARLEHEPRLRWLNGLLLRSLAQAEYRANNVGHFALASPAYVHFTSPIRRYADLISHRVMKAYLLETGGFAGNSARAAKMPERAEVSRMAFECSWRERSIANVERHTKSLYAAAFMRDRIGDRFTGTISGVTQAGVYVMLSSPYVDGFVPLGEESATGSERRWRIDDTGVRLVADGGRRVLALGDAVEVEIFDVSLARRRIEMRLVGEEAAARVAESINVGDDGRKVLRRRTPRSASESDSTPKSRSAPKAGRKAIASELISPARKGRSTPASGKAKAKVSDKASARSKTAQVDVSKRPSAAAKGKAKAQSLGAAKPAKAKRAPIGRTHPAKKSSKRK